LQHHDSNALRPCGRLSTVARQGASSKERTPVPSPIGHVAVETEERRALGAGLDAGRQPLTALNPGSVVAGAIAPMTSLVLSETERRFQLRGLPQAVGAARRALRDWERHFEPDLFYDLSLCVSELVTNTVRRGEPEAADPVELGVWRSATLIRAEIRQPRPDALVSKPATMVPRDWGMFIVDRVADRWGVDRSVGTLVWCEIDLARDGRSRRVLS
jgi:anti-sigma regulatory factor (Ser/Thr protein kinase)